jgi:ferredoxin
MEDQGAADKRARIAALAAVEALHPRATAVVEFGSQGRVLVVGGNAAWGAAKAMGPPLQPTLVATDPAPMPLHQAIPAQHVPEGAQLSLSGHLGAFHLTLTPRSGNPWYLDADLVLDLGDPPLVSDRLPPPGYRAPGPDQEAVKRATLELAELVGVFEKPAYFRYVPDLCAHSRNGVTACTRCIDSCPAEAIFSVGAEVQVDPNLCQGQGPCATACPSGAMRYAYPPPGDLLERLRVLLHRFRDAGGGEPRILIHDAADGTDWITAAGERLPPNLLPIVAEEVGSVGLEAWLCALAFGASDVNVLLPTGISPQVAAVLEQQASVATALLGGLGIEPERIRLLSLDRANLVLDALSSGPGGLVAAAAARFAVSDDKTVPRGGRGTGSAGDGGRATPGAIAETGGPDRLGR